MTLYPENVLLPTKHLRVFHKVARLASMSKAAEELRRAPSAVAHSIRQLELSLGATLFERTARGMMLTEAGKILVKRVECAFEEMQTVRAKLDEMHRDTDGARLHDPPIFSLAVNERRLAVLIAFSKRKHMGEVAKQMQISQPAVSMALRDLEGSTGLMLFDRSTPVVRLTSAGELLLMHLKRALVQLRLAFAEIAALNGVMEGHVLVGALPFGRAHILPTAIARIHKKYPLLHFTTIEGPFETLANALWCGDLDLILGSMPPVEHYSDLVREEIFGDRMAVIVRADHPLVNSGVPSMSQLLASYWVLPIQGTPTREVLNTIFETLGISEPRVAVESSDLSVIRGLLFNSDMITVASQHLFEPEIRSGLLAALPVELPQIRRPIGILRRKQDHSSPGAQLLIEEIRSIHTTS
ncbi:LysR family transcriptional regulator [Pusillimonas caeni]|uniref:LysR family transcriptional regulator n=1 Tax=Pusillimonas caeni TaxID=1348472 RepID=UPI000E59F264|nr:LysR family transcriptional regulator [Pusillimonas caeni]TFL14682.1 LysR family transcriptional regulator [Pusillimonas caeni]